MENQDNKSQSIIPSELLPTMSEGNNLTIEQLPEKIAQVVSRIKDIDKKIAETKEKASNVLAVAKDAKAKSAGFWGLGGTDAIKGLQEFAVQQADGFENFALIQEFILGNQKTMSNAVRTLFCMGVANMATTRTVIQILEKKLKNASEEELSELARQEIFRVVQELKARESMLAKLDRHKQKLANHAEALHVQKEELDKQKELQGNFQLWLDKVIAEVEVIKAEQRSLVEETKQTLANTEQHFLQKEDELQKNIDAQIHALQESTRLFEDKQAAAYAEMLKETENKIQNLETELCKANKKNLIWSIVTSSVIASLLASALRFLI